MVNTGLDLVYVVFGKTLSVNFLFSKYCKDFVAKPDLTSILIFWWVIWNSLNSKCTWAAEPPGQWGRVPTIYWKILCISKTIRQRSVGQTVQKLQLIMVLDFCKVLLTLGLKILAFFIDVNWCLGAISNLNWFYPKLQWATANF